MGNKISSVLRRKLNRFNVESRASKIIAQEKPTIAPKPESFISDLKRTLEVYPDYLEKQSKKDEFLDKRLKQVFVTSEDKYVEQIDKIHEDDKKLPLDRSIVEEFEYGHREPIKISVGRCTIRQAIKFITDNQDNPEVHTKEKISNDYKMKLEIVDNILKHFKSFQIFIPDITKKENILTQSQVKSIESKENEK